MTARATPSILSKGFIWVFVLHSADTGRKSVLSVVERRKKPEDRHPQSKVTVRHLGLLFRVQMCGRLVE